MWQAYRRCCRVACQISERLKNSKPESRGWQASRPLSARRFTGWWIEAQIISNIVWLHDVVTELESLIITAARSKVVAFTLPIYETHIIVVIRTESISSFFVIKPIRYRVWLSYAGEALFVTVTPYIFEAAFLNIWFHKSRLFLSAMRVTFRIVVYQSTTFLWLKYDYE